jgi:hypothetical protein
MLRRAGPDRFATRLHDRSRGLRVVQEALGHADLATAKVYTQVNNDRLEVAVDLLSYRPTDAASAGERSGQLLPTFGPGTLATRCFALRSAERARPVGPRLSRGSGTKGSTRESGQSDTEPIDPRRSTHPANRSSCRYPAEAHRVTGLGPPLHRSGTAGRSQWARRVVRLAGNAFEGLVSATRFAPAVGLDASSRSFPVCASAGHDH